MTTIREARERRDQAMRDLDRQARAVRYWRGTVTATAPLTVSRDGGLGTLTGPGMDCLIDPATLHVGDRVSVRVEDRSILIEGRLYSGG